MDQGTSHNQTIAHHQSLQELLNYLLEQHFEAKFRMTQYTATL